MENKFFNFIRPLLLSVDSGSFFRKPFSWIYLFIAFSGLLFSFFMVYRAVELHAAFQKRATAKEKFERISVNYSEIKYKYDEAEKAAAELKEKADDIYRDYTRAKNKADSYSQGGYYNYYQDTYERYKSDAARYYANWEEEDKKYQATLEEYDKLKPSFEKAQLEYEQLKETYEFAAAKYNDLASGSAFHGSDSGINSLLGLIVFSVTTLFLGWVIFQIWWDRRLKVNLSSREGDEFTVIPTIAHFIQTTGESLGVYIAIFGCSTAFIALVFKVSFGAYGLEKIFVSGLSALSENVMLGTLVVIAPLILGFFVIVLFRVIAESLKALVVIANNTSPL